MSDWTMDMWKYYDITHRDHVLCNPLHPEKLDELLVLLDLEPGARVVDIACGKAELLLRLHERYGIRGWGVDISPYVIAEATERKARAAPDAPIDFLEMDGASYEPEHMASLACTCCIGAEWVFDGFQNTLRTLAEWTRPGGWVLVGSPFWREPPPADYLETEGIPADTFGLHHEKVAEGEALGLSLCYTLVANEDDWDLYQGLVWRAVDAFSREHADDPDLEEIRRRAARDRGNYLRWERNCLGWAVYCFRK